MLEDHRFCRILAASIAINCPERVHQDHEKIIHIFLISND
jgi:hypothetical protein